MEGGSQSQEDLKEVYDHDRIILFLKNNGSDEAKDLWTQIIYTKFLISEKAIRDIIISIRHKLWTIKETTGKSDFDKAYDEVVTGSEKYIAGLKKLTGYLLHIFDEEKEKNIIGDVNAALANILGPNRNKIFYAFFDTVKNQNPEENGINMLEIQVNAFKEIEKKYHVLDVVKDKEALFDYFVRKYNNPEQKKDKNKSQET